MKAGARKGFRAALGVVLCVLGFLWARSTAYRESTALIAADGCHLVTDVIEPRSGVPQGSVVLVHGIAANKKIMAYLANAFAELGLRVFVPDLPGHGRTEGPFSFARADTCTESLVRELSARGILNPSRTLLVGHSMGGAIALRVASRLKVAGVVAISPAPMRAAHGLSADLLPYASPLTAPENTLVMSAAWEPFGIRAAAQDLVTPDSTTNKFLLMRRATHISVLFDPRVARASEDWAVRALGLQSTVRSPSSRMLAGSLVGFAGILLLAGPFLREGLATSEQPSSAVADVSPIRIPLVRAFLEALLASFVAVAALKLWNPLGFLHLFNGGYFASFLLLTGLLLLVIHHKSLRSFFSIRLSTLLSAAFAALALHLLITGWFDATLTEAWASASRWARFPVLLPAAFAYLSAEELLLNPKAKRRSLTQLGVTFALRFIIWIPLVIALFAFHSGAILLVLLLPYLSIFFLLQILGTQVVRRETRSPLAAALFGAILLAGFCLVIFPVT